MKRIAQIILLFSVLLLASCGGDRRVDDVLSAADSLVFVAPDSAVSLLGKTDLSAASVAQLDRHSLLLAKARAKGSITVCDDTPDSLLSRSIEALDRAADHYRGRGDSLEVQTLFYRGVLLGYRGDYSEALVSLMEAADRAADTGDNFYRAMSYREQAYVYSTLNEYEQAARLGQAAIEAFNLCNRPLHAAWERVIVPRSLSLSGKPKEAYDSIKTLSADSIIQSDSLMRTEFYSIAASICFYNNYMNKADSLFSLYVNSGGKISSRLLSRIALVKLYLGHTDEAKSLCDQALSLARTQTDTVATQFFMAEYHAKNNRFSDAYASYRQAQEENINKSNYLISHPYTALVNDHYRSEIERQSWLLEKTSTKVVIWVLIAIILSILLIVLLFAHRHKLRRKKSEIDDLINDLHRLEGQITLLSSKKNISNAEYPGVMDSLNSICEAKNRMTGHDNSERLFAKQVFSIISSIISDETIPNMEKFVDLRYDNLMSKFREQIVGLTEYQYKVALLVFLGFSNNSISAILGKSNCDLIRNARLRIRNKIRSNTTADSKLFLMFI